MMTLRYMRRIRALKHRRKHRMTSSLHEVPSRLVVNKVHLHISNGSLNLKKVGGLTNQKRIWCAKFQIFKISRTDVYAFDQ
jgi:hypothetical protein